jgi:uncharacterized membrane protein
LEVLDMSAEIYGPHKSSIGGMDANVMALIAYIGASVLSWIPGVKYVAWLFPLFLFFFEKNSVFVKFHAMQAFLLNAIGAVLAFLVSVVIGGIVLASINASTSLNSYTAALGAAGVIGFFATIIGLIILVFSIIALVSAYQYKLYKAPVLGNFAEKLAMKTGA